MDNAEYFCHKQPITTDGFSEYTISNISEKSSIVILIEQDFEGLDYLSVRLESSENENFENYNIIVEQTIHKNSLKEGAHLIVTFIPRKTLGCARLRFHTGEKTCTQGLITVMLKRESSNILEERKFLIRTDKYSIGEDGLIDSTIPLTDVCYKLALQLQHAKAEKQDLINYYELREGGMLEDIQHWKNKAQEFSKEFEQYKKSKQASYESMQIEWNKAVNELRDLKAMQIERNTEINEVRKMLSCWCIDFMDKIEEIAHKKYPSVTYWCDTGSRWNVIMAMLQQFEDDLKVRK